METKKKESADTCKYEEGKPSSIGITPRGLPEVYTPREEKDSQTGVSTGNAIKRVEGRFSDTYPNPLLICQLASQNTEGKSGICHQKHLPETVCQSTTHLQQHRYALRTTYGRERNAYEFIVSRGGVAFYPTIITTKELNDKIKLVEVSRIPNLFFAYGTKEEIKSYTYTNCNLPLLTFLL